MKNFLAFLCFLCFYSSFSQKTIVVIGSSTASGVGASVYDSSWVGRLQHSFSKNKTDGIDTNIINLARGGYTTYKTMPTGFVSNVPNRPSPCSDSNITKAISYNPDIILISLPTNDIASGYPETEVMNNFRYLVQVIRSYGIKYFITTSQPRNDLDSVHRSQLRQLTDSINLYFTWHVLNFWDDLATNDGSFKFRTDLTRDGVHPTDAGHQYLYQRVRAKSIFTADTTLSSLSLHTEAENYVNMSGVGTESTTDTGRGLDVNYIDPGDWMDYNINVPSAGSYKIDLRIATPSNSSLIQIKKGDGSVLCTVQLPNTGGFQIWHTTTANLTLGQGWQRIRLESISPLWNNWNINWFNIQTAGTLAVPPPPSSKIHIEAEDYASMFGVGTENTADVGGGLNVSYIDPGDWMDYKVNVPVAGTYTLNFRIATPAAHAQLEVKKADSSLLAQVNLPNTGGYQVWQTASYIGIHLSRGWQTLRLVSSSPQWNNWNINWLDLYYTGIADSPAVAAANYRAITPVQAKAQLSINNVFIASDNLKAEVNLPDDKEGEIWLYSLTGDLIRREKRFFVHPRSFISTSVANLPTGPYVLKVSTPSGSNTRQFMLVR